jgi:hypothetical protein
MIKLALLLRVIALVLWLFEVTNNKIIQNWERSKERPIPSQTVGYTTYITLK